MKGFIRKKDNTYYAIINIKDSNGKWKKKWISTKTGDLRKAKKVLKKILAEHDFKNTSTNKDNSNKLMFHELMELWLSDVIKNKVEETTYQGYCVYVNTHVIPYFKSRNITVENLTVHDFNKFFSTKVKKHKNDITGLSGNYLKKMYYNMKNALDYAVDVLEIIDKNPILKATTPKIEEYITRYYSVEELRKLLEVTRGTLIETAVFLGTNYGFRRGEVLGLRWQDINFYDNTVTVNNTRTRMTKEIEKKPKTKSSNRTLPLMEHVRYYLLNLRERQKAEEKFLGYAYSRNDYVCRYPDGKPLNISTLDQGFSRILKKYNLPHIRFHDLRHSTGSYLLKNRHSLKEIQLWLGHADIQSAARYTQVDTTMKIEMGNNITGMFGDKDFKNKKNN